MIYGQETQVVALCGCSDRSPPRALARFCAQQRACGPLVSVGIQGGRPRSYSGTQSGAQSLIWQEALGAALFSFFILALVFSHLALLDHGRQAAEQAAGANTQNALCAHSASAASRLTGDCALFVGSRWTSPWTIYREGVDDELRPNTNQIQAAAADLAASLAQGNQSASIHLARLILADRLEDQSTYQLLVHALTQQMRRWTGRLQAIREEDVARMLKSAARELIREDWDD